MENSLTRFALSLEEIEKVDEYRRSHKVFLLTIVLSDIVGYSTLCERLPDTSLMDFLKEFESLTKYHFEEHKGGLIIKRIGDAVLVVFAEPVSAVLAVLEFHKELKNKKCAGVKLQARSGIHMGQVTVEQKGIQLDIFGRHVNRVARVEAAAEPDEILVTDAVEDNVRTMIGENNVRFFRRRALRLKGIENPVTVFTVDAQGSKEHTHESPLPETYIIIEVVQGSGRAKTWVFDAAHDRRIIIGRNQSCDVWLDDPRVSRKHAMLIYDDTCGWTLGGLGGPGQRFSSSPLLVNGETITSAIVKPGDQITVGGSCIIIRDMRPS